MRVVELELAFETCKLKTIVSEKTMIVNLLGVKTGNLLFSILADLRSAKNLDSLPTKPTIEQNCLVQLHWELSDGAILITEPWEKGKKVASISQENFVNVHRLKLLSIKNGKEHFR